MKSSDPSVGCLGCIVIALAMIAVSALAVLVIGSAIKAVLG